MSMGFSWAEAQSSFHATLLLLAPNLEEPTRTDHGKLSRAVEASVEQGHAVSAKNARFAAIVSASSILAKRSIFAWPKVAKNSC
jgi:hypothetical protein